jgi:4-amino-4-deoxy-L-arabinose transferase-like glycosyltransferase
VKPNLILFSPLIVFLFLLSFDAPLRRKLVLGGVAVLVALLVLAPWLLRNYALVGAPIVSLSPAVNLIVGLGTHEESALVSTGVPIDGICCRMPYWNASAYPTLVGIEHAIITREGILYLALRQLAYAPRVYFDRAFYVTLAKITDIPADLVAKAIATLQGILLVLLVAGLFSMARTKYFWHACLFFLMIASVLVLNARVSYSRMLIPLYPMFATLAGIALTQIINLFRSKETS